KESATAAIVMSAGSSQNVSRSPANLSTSFVTVQQAYPCRERPWLCCYTTADLRRRSPAGTPTDQTNQRSFLVASHRPQGKAQQPRSTRCDGLERRPNRETARTGA